MWNEPAEQHHLKRLRRLDPQPRLLLRLPTPAPAARLELPNVRPELGLSLACRRRLFERDLLPGRAPAAPRLHPRSSSLARSGGGSHGLCLRVCFGLQRLLGVLLREAAGDGVDLSPVNSRPSMLPARCASANIAPPLAFTLSMAAVKAAASSV